MEIIMNGGNPLPGCPTNWDEAQLWEDMANYNKSEYDEPMWKFDCGFKLDFDGPILRVSSRFYPPKEHYGAGWNGTISVYIFGEKIADKEINTDNLNELKTKADNYTKEIAAKIRGTLTRL
jgi:hypothetical protein